MPDDATADSAAVQQAWAELRRYSGWLGRDHAAKNVRAAVDALGVALDQHGGPDATAAAIAKVEFEVEKLYAIDLRPSFRLGLTCPPRRPPVT